MLDARSVRSLWEVVSTHPSAFLHNWYYNLLRLPRLELVQFPLELVAYAGMVFSLGQRIDNRASTVMFLSFTAFSGAICMAFANERLLLFPGMLLCIFGAYGILAFVPRGLTVAAGRSLPLQKLLLILLCVWLIWVYVRPPLLDPLPQKDADRIRVAHTLKDDGVSDSSAVLSMSFDYYDLSSRTKDRYSIPWYGGGFETYKSVSDIASRMRLAKQTHLVFDDTAHRKVRGLKDIWPLDPVQLREHFDHLASFSGSVQVYRLRPLAGGGVER